MQVIEYATYSAEKVEVQYINFMKGKIQGVPSAKFELFHILFERV